jgi:hypothetical protein
MLANTAETTPSLREELIRRGKAIYETRLKALVEPQYNNQYIAIHVDSEDYTVAKSTGAATRSLLKTHPADGRIYLRKIGDEPDYSLAARILAGEMMAEQTK